MIWRPIQLHPELDLCESLSESVKNLLSPFMVSVIVRLSKEIQQRQPLSEEIKLFSTEESGDSCSVP